MSTYDDASLIYYPSGYKASKAYSLKPTDGSGDLTFTRASTATRVNESGLIELVATGVPRIDFTSGCGKLLLEPQRSNILLQSEDISSASWIKNNSPVITSNIAVSPDGTTSADGIKSDTVAAFQTISQVVSVSANSTITTSVFVKKEISETFFGGFACIFSGGTTKILRVVVNAVIGTANVTTDSTLSAITKVEDYGNYWRVSATATDNGSNTFLSYIYYGTLSTNGTTTATGVGSVRTIWGFQLEASSAYPTSYIPTTTTAVTRVADSASKTAISSLIGQTQGTIFFDLNNVTGTVTGTGNPDIAFKNTAFNNWMGLTTNIFANPFRFTFRSATTLIDYSANITRAKVACSYGAFGVKLFVNGALVASSVTIPTTTFDILDLKGGIIKSELNSVMSFLLPKSDSDLIALTTL